MSASDEAARWEALERLEAEFNGLIRGIYLPPYDAEHPVRRSLIWLADTVRWTWLWGLEELRELGPKGGDHYRRDEAVGKLIDACWAFADLELFARRLGEDDLADRMHRIHEWMKEALIGSGVLGPTDCREAELQRSDAQKIVYPIGPILFPPRREGYERHGEGAGG
jgi:hypothetical protein